MLVDDAHGAGVLGKTGLGTLEHAGVSRQGIIQTITLSKAFGVYGGAILGTRSLRRRIIGQSRMFIGSTPLPLPLANAAIQAVRLLQSKPSFLKRLRANANYVKQRLRERSSNVHGVVTPARVSENASSIISLVPRSLNQVEAINRALLRARIFPPFLRYPGGPPNGYFRFVISGEHSRQQLDALVSALTVTVHKKSARVT